VQGQVAKVLCNRAASFLMLLAPEGTKYERVSDAESAPQASRSHLNKAYADCAHAVSLDPAYERAHLRMATCLLKIGQVRYYNQPQNSQLFGLS
jgi:hypothetical protein